MDVETHPDPTDGGGEHGPCSVCSEPVAGRPTATALQRGSCTRCGLQLVRDPGGPWREIRG